MSFGVPTEFGQPIILVADQQEKRRLKGYEAHSANILSCLQVVNPLRTSFGPRGMDKIVVSPDGDVVVSNDGATILKKMPVEHECAKLLVDVSQSQDDEIGDGTTGVVILAGGLLKQALKLLEKKVHPLKIADGFDRACEIAVAYTEKIAKKVEVDRSTLKKAAMTALCSKVVSSKASELAEICVDAVLAVYNKELNDVNFDLIKVEIKPGGKLEDTTLIHGIALDKDFSHSQMKKQIKDARIAILTCPFEPPKPKTKHKLSIKTTEAYNELFHQEQQYFKDMVTKVKASGANVVICQWGFDDEANHLLLRNDLPAVRWVGGQEIELVSLATGGQIVARFEDLTPEKLGRAECVRETTIGTEEDKLVLIEGCPKGRAVTILVRGGNFMVIQEAKRCIHDALCVIRNVITDPRVVPGGGAVETACALEVTAAAKEVTTVEQHAIEGFAEALLGIPEALAENSGLDAIETLGDLRGKQVAEKNPNLGVDCISGKIADMIAMEVYEGANSKIHQLALASQVVRMILKIDDIIVPSENQ